MALPKKVKKKISSRPTKTKATSISKAKDSKASKALALVVPQVITTPLPLVKIVPKWDEAYPYVEESYKIGGQVVQVPKYYSAADRNPVEFEKFLHQVVRLSSVPNFIKNNFKKIRKLVEKEIQHREKLLQKLSREQMMAFVSYFWDDKYFDRTDGGEYFEHELEKVYVAYLKGYCETGLYEARVRLGTRKRKDIMLKYGVQDHES
jgi:hypothetical protein